MKYDATIEAQLSTQLATATARVAELQQNLRDSADSLVSMKRELERELADETQESDVLRRLYDQAWDAMRTLFEMAYDAPPSKRNCPELQGATTLGVMLEIVGDHFKAKLADARARERRVVEAAYREAMSDAPTWWPSTSEEVAALIDAGWQRSDACAALAAVGPRERRSVEIEAHLNGCLIRLEHCREAIGSLPIDALGEANDGEDVWPLRDELVDRITATVSAARAALRDEPAPGEQTAQEEGE